MVYISDIYLNPRYNSLLIASMCGKTPLLSMTLSKLYFIDSIVFVV